MAALRLSQCVARRTTASRCYLRTQAVAKPSSASTAPQANDAAQMQARPRELPRNDADWQQLMQVFKLAACTTVAGNMMLAGQADAAQVVADVAATDNRVSVLLALFLPVVGWVGFNILGPALAQMNDMSAKQRGLLIGSGLGLAALLTAGNAEAAQEVLSLAEKDNRLTVLLALFLPVVGWVGFNILGPALSQVNEMADKQKSVVAGTGLGLASLLAAGNADAAQLVMDVAEKDNRFAVLLTLFLPVIGWVGFNILGPALSQVDEMSNKNKSIVAGAGLGLASLLAAGNADAAQLVMDVAEKDNRVLVLLTLFLPVVGWVGFNILGPALSQVNEMSEKNK